METLDTLPMSILSGNYKQNYWQGSPINSVMSTYRERQPGRDVAAARQGVVDQRNANRAIEFADSRKADIDAQITQLESEIKDLEEQLNLALITTGSGVATAKDTTDQAQVPVDNNPPDANLWLNNYKQGI